MRADSVTSSNIKNRIGSKGASEKVTDVRLLLEEKRHGSPGLHQPLSSVKSGKGFSAVDYPDLLQLWRTCFVTLYYLHNSE